MRGLLLASLPLLLCVVNAFYVPASNLKSQRRRGPVSMAGLECLASSAAKPGGRLMLLAALLPAWLGGRVKGFRLRPTGRSRRTKQMATTPAAEPGSPQSIVGGSTAVVPALLEEPSGIPIVIRYTGGAGYKSLYAGCVRVLRDAFPYQLSIRKVIVGNLGGSGSSKTKGTFEIILGDQVYSKSSSSGVFLPMQDIRQQLERLSRARSEVVEVDGRRPNVAILAKSLEDEVAAAVAPQS